MIAPQTTPLTFTPVQEDHLPEIMAITADAYPDSHINLHTYPNRHPDADSYCDSYADTYCYHNADQHADTDTDRHVYTDADSI